MNLLVVVISLSVLRNLVEFFRCKFTALQWHPFFTLKKIKIIQFYLGTYLWSKICLRGVLPFDIILKTPKILPDLLKCIMVFSTGRFVFIYTGDERKKKVRLCHG